MNQISKSVGKGVNIVGRDKDVELVQNLLTRIPQMTFFSPARDLRQAPEKQGCSANSCHAHRGTQWVTAKLTICESVLTVA